jgi:hypothetical protein
MKSYSCASSRQGKRKKHKSSFAYGKSGFRSVCRDCDSWYGVHLGWWYPWSIEVKEKMDG